MANAFKPFVFLRVYLEMRKTFILIICLLLVFAGMSQQRFRPQRPDKDLPARYQQLKLSADQRTRIANLIRRQRIQKILDQKALEAILTPEQKQKLLRWKEDKNKADSTKN